MASHRLLLPWCIYDHQIRSDNGNSQQQPTAGYKETSKSIPVTSPPTRVKATTNTCDNSTMLYAANFMITYVTGSAKTVPNCARTEIKCTAKH